MPRLEWIGKEKVINHHLEVPFRVLNRKYSFDPAGQKDEDNGSQNKIIHGDNLLALKSLLPEYEGKIKCIYIDPPYNTGNEGWVYNDNVNSPKIKKWLGEVVGKEGDDLSRHDKWLCMMYPRLKLLQKLLADDGAIFISIDDNEQASLRLICDEIFGRNCFVANISWQRVYCPRNDSNGIPSEVDHIMVYSKKSKWEPQRLMRTDEMDGKYSSPDNDKVLWTSAPAHAPGAATHTGMVYAVQHPITGKLIYPPVGRCWSFGQNNMLDMMNEWNDYELREISDYDIRKQICRDVEKTPLNILAVMLKEEDQRSLAKSMHRYECGCWPTLYFTNKGKGGMRKKTYIDNVPGKVVTNFWPYIEVGHNDEASKELKKIFNGKIMFDTPKPVRLLDRIIKVIPDKNAIFLDSFAGSGTTAHAILNLNKEDGGNRKFILVEMDAYADTITAERVKRVIQGYGDNEGIPGDFSYYEIGEPLIENDVLNSHIAVEQIRSYIWYMETRQPYQKPATDNEAFLGMENGTAYYFHYDPAQRRLLDEEFLRSITTRAEHYVIYADECLLSEAFLQKHVITFKKIPRDIARL